MNFIVQKYGGTSIGTAERLKNVASIVKSTQESGVQPVVVLSAMSSVIKAQGTTSQLLKAIDALLTKGSYYKIIDEIEENHIKVIKDIITSPMALEATLQQVHAEFKSLKSFLDALQIIGEVSPRSYDIIISTGEKLAACIFAGLLNSNGIDACYVPLDTLIQESHSEVDRHFCAYARQEIRNKIESCGTSIPILTGFIGPIQGGIMSNIGRGYSDFTAALIAAALQATEFQIWKEVDGIFSADPNKVPQAHILKAISPNEALELSFYGSEVIHPFTMEQVQNAGIVVRIKNTFAPQKEGTLITDSIGTEKTIASAVTTKNNITILNVHSNRMLMSYGFMHKVFEILAKHKIVIDLISTSEANISMTLTNNELVENAIPELEKIGHVSVHKNMSIISLIGAQMHSKVGTASLMFAALKEANINIEMISQGASEINISCIIEGTNSIKALQAVHKLLET